MNFEAVFKIIVGAVISMVVASYSMMKDSVVSNKVKIENLDTNMNKMGRKIDEIHWFLLKERK
tara:strand:- start:2001 stop:2189 length:189 start_codon:yes stop_codon:yes gene_type:complete